MKTSFRTYVFLITSFLTIAGMVLPPQAFISQNGRDASAKNGSDPDEGTTPTALLSKRRGASSGNRSGASKSSKDLFAQTFLADKNKNATLNSALRAQSLQAQGIEAVTSSITPVIPAEFNGDLRNLPRAVPSKPRRELELKEPTHMLDGQEGEGGQDSGVNNIPTANMPAPIQNFDGVVFNTPVTGGSAGDGWPPDINGDVGTSHYIESVNSSYAIYSKTTGAQLAAFTENSLFSNGTRPGGMTGTGTLCDTDSFGDPVVVYDQFADRFILTNFAFVLVGNNQIPPTYQCFAVSKTSNPVTGGWWLYAVQIDTNAAGQPPTGTLGDYPKFGNWNDGCLYMGANAFDVSGNYSGQIVASLNKSDMENGLPLTASLAFISTTGNPFTMIPSNLSGARGAAFVPPSGTPNYYVNEFNSGSTLQVRKFTPGTTPKQCGGGGTIGSTTTVTHASYTNPNAVPQPGTAQTLDSIDRRIMQKVQYRRVGAAESLWVVHTVRSAAGSTKRPHWMQLDVTAGVVAATPVQEQIYAPDTTLNRWMGSLAVDHLGNMALGYSTSNGTSPNFPSIQYAGRLVTDPVNTLPQAEQLLFAGTGSQTANNRWGDYTSMSVDPVDDCTFWYTNEYYVAGDGSNWHTRIGSFKFPTCTGFPTAADANIAGQVLDSTGTPLGG
ncbi:MAG: hypothetical protein WCB68_22195, partial [Pyrinomonadaceae bacterium]